MGRWWSWSLVALTLVMTSCGEVEGDEPGECTDGADNDRDGYFDCQDNDCWGSPDCDDVGTDTGTDSDSDTQSGELDARLKPLKGVDINYSLAYDLAVPMFGMSDCVIAYLGTGDSFVDGANTRVTFDGTWKIDKGNSTCPEELHKSLWVGDGAGFQSFVFSEDVTQLTEWYAHRVADGHTEDAGDGFYITEMDGAVDVSSSAPNAHYELTEDVVEIHGQLIHTLDVTFRK